MPLNINFNRTNDMIKMLSNLFLEKKMGDLTKQRQFDVMAEQDRLMRERAAKEDVASRSMEQYKSGINVNEYIKKAFIDTARSNDAYDYNIRSAQISEQAGDIEKARLHYNKAFDLSAPALVAATNALKGKVSAEDFAASINALGSEGFQKIMTEAGQSARAATSAELERSRQGQEAQKIGIEREKLGIEKGTVGKAGKTETDRRKKQIEDIINFYEPIARGADNPMYQEVAGYMIKQFSEMSDRLPTGLTKDDEKSINEARDFKNVILKYQEKKLLGQPKYRSGILEEQTNKALESEITPTQNIATAPTQTPAITIPANAPKAYNPTTGEMAYWDGTKWIIVK